MKRIAFSLIMSLLMLAVNAAEAGDSLSRALAAYWGSSVKIGSMTAEQREQFSRGMEEAVTADNDSVR